MKYKEPFNFQNLEGFWFGGGGRDQEQKAERMGPMHFYTKKILLALSAKKCVPLWYSLPQARPSTTLLSQ